MSESISIKQHFLHAHMSAIASSFMLRRHSRETLRRFWNTFRCSATAVRTRSNSMSDMRLDAGDTAMRRIFWPRESTGLSWRRRPSTSLQTIRKKTDRFDTGLLARAFTNTSYKLFYIRIEQDLMTKEKIRML